ncbi:MAG TPA: MBL fold metallo-hydrolase [Burkholderiales bacterium]|nr:MBL fold metallo-hydrolase [Burkholderiales bacterium]
MKNSALSISRRGLLTGLAATPALALASSGALWADEVDAAQARAQAALKEAKGTKLVLLGTGAGPNPGQALRMTSHVMVHDGAAYVLDCGLGLTNQFRRAGIQFSAVRAIFITHHHPDHNIEYGPFLVIGWIFGLQQSVRAYGPPPLVQMTEDYFRSAKATIDFWAEDFQRKPLEMIEVHELTGAGRVMQDDLVRVTAALVEHPPVTPAFGYRFDFPDRSIAFSGDTVPVEAMVQLARGADILVHEAIDMQAMEIYSRENLRVPPQTLKIVMDHMRAGHSPTEDVGRIAQEANVKTLVLSHLAPNDMSVSDASWRGAAAKHFKGEIIVGHDLMVI